LFYAHEFLVSRNSKGDAMSKHDTTYKEFLEIAERQMSVPQEPRNGGGSIADFMQAMAKVDDDYKCTIPFSIRLIHA